MASTYSPNLRLELIGTGEQQGTWGSTTNTNLGTLLEEAIGGYVSVTVTDGADTTLTSNNGSADQSRNMVINLTGTISAARNVICPAIEKLYVVKNATTGGFAVTFKVSGQTGVSVPNGSTYFLYVDGTDARLITGTIASQNSNNVSITGGSLSNVSVVANASSLSVRDSDGSNILSIAVGSNLTANTILTLTTGATSNRTLDISASNVTISTAGAELIDDADASAQRTTLGLGTIATQNANNVSITGGALSGLSNLSVANVTVAATVRTNLGLGSGDSPEFTAVNIGSATDTTLSRSAAGVLAVEGNLIPSPASQAHGDVLYRGASGWERLAAGTSGLYLKTLGAGAAPAWDTPTGGAWTVIGTATPSNSAAVTFTNLSSYRNLCITVVNMRPATDSTLLYAEGSTDNGVNWSSLDATYGGLTLGAATYTPTSESTFPLKFNDTGAGNVASDGPIHSEMIITNFNKAANKAYQWWAVYGNNVGAQQRETSVGWTETSTVYNALRLRFNTGNIAEGFVLLEGYVG